LTGTAPGNELRDSEGGLDLGPGAKADPEAGSRFRPRKSLLPDIGRVFVARSLRAFGDGYVAILLPVHLSRLGYDAFGVGLISTASLESMRSCGANW
jgi:hypothetical protein